MPILGKFPQKSTETSDYPLDFTEWFANRDDQPASFVVILPPGCVGSLADAGMVAVLTFAAPDAVIGDSFRIVVRVTTDSIPPVVKDADFVIKIKDFS